MSPDLTFWLDAEGYAHYAILLEAAGMHFSEEPSIPGAVRSVPGVVSVRGTLVSPHGAFRARMTAYRGEYCFVVTVLDEADIVIGVLDDLERAFAGHLLARRRPTA